MIRTPLVFIGICSFFIACQSVFPGKDPRGIRDSVFVADSLAAMAWLEQKGFEIITEIPVAPAPSLPDTPAVVETPDTLQNQVLIPPVVTSDSVVKPKPKPRPKPKPVPADTTVPKKRNLPVLQPIAPPPPPALTPVTPKDTAKGGL